MKIVAFSDQHGKLPKLPDGDLYVCAGDCCPDFAPGSKTGSALQAEWLNKKWVSWMGNRNYVATLGNHDFISRYEVPHQFGIDRADIVDGVKFWLSPWSNTFGGWAWMQDPLSLEIVYAAIPDDIDIIVSHQPPYGYGDQVPPEYVMFNEDAEGHVGSKELLAAIDRVNPRFVICGHIHNGRGTYMRDDTTILNVALVNEQYQRVHEPVEFEI